MKFKVGDKVRALRDYGVSGLWYKRGRIMKVRYVRSVEVYEFEEHPGGEFTTENDYCLMPDGSFGFELVKEESKESELERLVRIANEGEAAIDQIMDKHSHEVESGTLGTMQLITSRLRGPTNWRFRIKPKAPSFEPYTTSNGLKVSLEGSALDVGCSRFYAPGAIGALRALLDGSACVSAPLTEYGDRVLYSYRQGIGGSAGYQLPWADADELLRRLEKAGIE